MTEKITLGLQDGTIGQTKTRKSRSVPPPVPTYEALKPQLVGRGRQADLWISDLGEPLLYRAFRYRWKKIIRAAALGWEPTAHDLRLYYASRLIHQGVDVVRVAGYLGHVNVTKTLNIYGYLMGQDHSDVAPRSPNCPRVTACRRPGRGTLACLPTSGIPSNL